MKRALQFAFTASLLLVVQLVGPAQAQNTQAQPTTSSMANPSDVDSVDHILNALYDSISGPAGTRNWDRFRSLFYSDARLIPSHRDQAGKIMANSLTVEQYIDRAKAYFEKEGFYEAALANRVEIWDHIAHVWSTYESRHTKTDKPFARGINSIQLFNDGSRWWVISVYWEGEEPAHPLPEKYLK